MRLSNVIHSTDAPIICTRRAARSTSVHRRLTVLQLSLSAVGFMAAAAQRGGLIAMAVRFERDENSRCICERGVTKDSM